MLRTLGRWRGRWRNTNETRNGGRPEGWIAMVVPGSTSRIAEVTDLKRMITLFQIPPSALVRVSFLGGGGGYSGIG